MENKKIHSVRNIQRIILALALAFGLGALAPHTSEASTNNGSPVQFSFNAYQIMEKTTKSVQQVKFVNTQKGTHKKFVHLIDSNGLASVVKPELITFIQANRNYSEKVVTMNYRTGKTTSVQTTVYLKKSLFDKTVATYKHTFKKRPHVEKLKKGKKR